MALLYLELEEGGFLELEDGSGFLELEESVADPDSETTGGHGAGRLRAIPGLRALRHLATQEPDDEEALLLLFLGLR